MIDKLEIEYVPIEQIKPNEYNPKRLTEKEAKDLEKSIVKFGVVDPLIVNKAIGREGILLGGHQRLNIYQKLKYKEVPVVWVDEPDLKREQELCLRLSKNTGSWSDDLLCNFDDDLLLEIGWEQSELDFIHQTDETMMEDDFDLDKAIEREPKFKVVRGDLFCLGGRHYLLCGDACNAEDVSRLMGEDKADLAFNDPPYGMKKEKEGVINDNLNYDDLLAFNKEWIPLQITYIKDAGSWYCWGTDEPLMDIYSQIIKPYIKTQKATFRNLITWDKGNGQGQMSADFRMYPIADEKCLFVMMGVQGFNTNADNYFEGWEPIRNYLLEQRQKAGWNIPTMKMIAGHSDKNRDHWTGKSQFDLPTKEVYQKFQAYCQQNNIDAFKKEYDVLKKEYYDTRAYFDNTHENQNNVWHFSRDTERAGEHATPKPVDLCTRAIKSSCPKGGLVIDFFLGSGSTLIACEKTERRLYGIEISPIYISVCLERMLALDPTISITKNGEPMETQ
ncbi:site-specific DNA-methyltransferase [Pedobacter sp.]|uniref:site-specific DNA-methyltransferase n=1 Tax=Pedobacter sp. TaxID=1411316 RepID=UPI00356660E5